MAEATKTKIAYVIGKERCDIIYFLHLMSEKANKKLLIVDNSKLNDLYQIYDGKTEDDYVEIGNTIIVRATRYSEVFEEFDNVIVYGGMNRINEVIQEKADIIYAVTSYEKAEVMKLKGILKQGKIESPVLIFRDKAGKKISEGYVEELLGKTGCKKMVLPLDQMEYEMYLSLQHNGTASIQAMSESMKDVITQMSEDLFGLDEKTIAKLFKK